MKKSFWFVGASMALLVAVVGVVVLVVLRGGGEQLPDGAGEAQMDDMDMPGMAGGDDGSIHVEPELARSLGIRLSTAEIRPLRREIRTTGTVTYDETRLSTVTTKIGGFVEDLHVDFTGQEVRRGDPLLDIYSPELLSAQEELLAAVRLEARLSESAAPGVAERSGGLAEAARRRLLLWDISPEQVQRIEQTGEVQRTLTLHAPFAGVVVDKAVQVGESVQPGGLLFRLADLSEVWVEADVYERDLRHVRVGETVEVDVDAYPGEGFRGVVSYVHPDVSSDTRTGRVRIQLDNPAGRLKPGMFATVRIEVVLAERALLVPRDAVMRTGTQSLVFVEQAPGRYEPREVCVGAEAGDAVQILTGLLAGEPVVARANFMLDAESRLMETMTGMPGMPGMDMDVERMEMPGTPDPRSPEC